MIGISLGRWFGVFIRLHHSWFVIAALIWLSLARGFSAANPNWPQATVWITAMTAAALFFASIVVHELAHAAVARAGGMRVRGITLFALGGIADILDRPKTASREIWMAGAGPAASIAIGAVCSAAAQAQGWLPGSAAPSATIAVLGWIGYLNLGLALFNLLPGFPLDGGRILRALLWAATGEFGWATTVAAQLGRVVAVLFMVLGIIALFGRGDIGGLWLAIIGWFLLEAARAEIAALPRSEFQSAVWRTR